MRNNNDELLIAFIAVLTVVFILMLYIMPMYTTDRAIERAKNEIIEEMQQQEIRVKVIYEQATPTEPSDDEISIVLRDEYKGVDDE